MTVLSPFDEVVRDFAEAQHLPRIKKLLVYACTQRWESDPDQLARFNLHTLVETLMQIAPTLDQLSTYLHEVTQTLSKSAEYLLIANTVIRHFRKLYDGPVSSSNLNANPHIYWQIAQALENDSEHLRIRKLLVLVCRNYWESDRERLLAISLPDLLAELHQLTQNFDHLKAVIDSVVQTTSKPYRYEAIADRITEACQTLYVSQQLNNAEFETFEDSLASGPTYITQATSISQATSTSPKSTDSSTDSSADSFDNMPTAIYSQKDLIEAEAEADVGTGAEADADVGQDTPVAIDLDTQLIPVFSKAELYDLRLEIMKYTVPLLSKHLLFLTVYTPPGQATEEEQAAFADDPDAWMNLKNRDLDDLIKASLKQYPTLRDLDGALHLTTKALEASQRYMPVARAIMRAVKTLTVKHQIPFPNTKSTAQISQNMQDKRVFNGEAHTCQLSSATIRFKEESANSQSQSIRINRNPVKVKAGVGAVSNTQTSHHSLSGQQSSPSAETTLLTDPSCPSPPDAQPNSSDQDRTQSERSPALEPASSQTDNDAKHSLSDRQASVPKQALKSNLANSTDETALLK